MADRLGQRQRRLLLATQLSNGLLQLAVQRRHLRQRHADPLRDGEEFALRDHELALASGRELQARHHQVPLVGNLHQLRDLLRRPGHADEGQQLRPRPSQLIAERRRSRLELRHPLRSLRARGLRGRRHLVERALGRRNRAFETLIRALQGDEEGDAVGHGLVGLRWGARSGRDWVQMGALLVRSTAGHRSLS